MKAYSRTSLRFRLLLLVGFALLPMAALLFYYVLHERDRQLAGLNEDVLQLGGLTAGNMSQLIRGTGQTLASLSNTRIDTTDPAASGSLLADLLGRYAAYANIGLVQSDGLVVASAIPLTRTVYYNNQPWFRRLQQTRNFTIGDYEIDAITRRECLNFSFPTRGTNRNQPSAVFLSLPLETLQKAIEQAYLPQDSVVNIVDQTGTEMARVPQIPGYRGKKSRAWLQLQPALKNPKVPRELVGLDNVSRLYHFTPVPDSNGSLWVGVGLTRAGVLAQTNRNLRWGMGSMLLVAACGLFLAWYGSEVSVLRPVRSLTQASRRLAHGDLGARTNASYAPKELRVLAQTFDEMAASLQKNQEELRRTQFAVDCAPEPIWWADSDGRFVYANEAAVAILGYSVHELRSMRVHQITETIPEETWPSHWKELVRRRTWIFETVCRTRNGKFPVEITANYLKFADMEYDCAFLHNITKRKKSEEDLRKLNSELEQRVRARTAQLEATNESLVAEINERHKVEAFLRENQRIWATLMSNLPGMAYRCRNDQDWTLDFASEGALDLTGYAPFELVNSKVISYAQIIHPDDRSKVWDAIQPALECGESFRIVYRIICRGGQQKWVSEVGRGVFGQNDQLIALEGIIVDTTERKLAEEEVFRAHAMLELILDNIPQRVFWKDRQSKYLGCNKSFSLDASMKDPQEVAGKSDYELFSQKDAEAFRADDQWVMENNSSKLNFEEPQGMLNGVQKWLRTNKVPLHDQEGSVIGLLGTYEDITEHRQMEQKLRESLDNLERSNKELEQFAYVASHDLQEPLRLISSYTQLLADRYRGKLDASADEFIEYAVDGARRMQRLIQDLLAYSRVNNKEAPLMPTDCGAALRQAIRNLSLVIDETRAQITMDLLPMVLATENQMVQLFQNLIGNALKFHGSEPPKIHVGARQDTEAGQWIVSVQDNGIGIAPEFFERIFAIFQRLHSRRKYSGTGIGLAICKRIVERHGGRIWVESEPNKGSTFYFTLREISATKT